MGVGVDKADRVVQFMRHASQQAAQGCQLFVAHQLALRLLQRLVAFGQFGKRTAEFTKGTTRQNDARHAAATVKPWGDLEFHGVMA